MILRLDKFLSNLGMGTRSEIKKQIGFGNIKVNRKVVRKPETKIDTDVDVVEYKKEKLCFEEFVYYVLNKPQGVITATEDKKHRTVMDLIADKRKDLAPVGRLDIDTEGLLLITNDGELAHRLLSPKKHVDKTYYAKIKGDLPEDACERFEAGIQLDENTLTMPAGLKLLGKGIRQPEHAGSIRVDAAEHASSIHADAAEHAEVEVTIREGKFHQVKRMFLKLGCEVVFLKRIRMGNLRLEELDLKVGEYRRLSREEVGRLKQETECECRGRIC